MKNITKKKYENENEKKNNKNNTKKKRKIIQHIIEQNNNNQIVCKSFPNTYNTFEDKIEKLFKQNKIDFLSVNYNLEKQILKDLKKAVSPSNISPKNDFYSYINDRWLKDFEISTGQKYIIQIDNFRIVQDKVYRELIQIVEDFISNSKKEKKNTKKIKCLTNAYNSFKHYNTNEQSRKYANETVQMVDELFKDKNNLWKLLGTINKNEIISWTCPFVWTLNPDEKNPKKYKCYLEPPQVTLIDVNLYFDDGTDVSYKAKYRKTYFEYLNNLFQNTFGKNHQYNVRDIFNCEIKLINAMNCYIIKENMDNNYNVISKDEAINLFHFNWSEFCKEMGFTNVPSEFVTSNVNYLLCGTKLLLEEWNTPEWRTFWIYINIKQQQRFNEKGYKNFFNFHGNFVRGQEQIVDNAIKPIYGVSYLFNSLLTNEYISKYKNEQAVNYVKTMAEDLKTVFIRIIKRNKWLQPKTKEKALKKLINFKLIVGSPSILREDPLLDYTDDDPWGNLVKMSLWRNKKAIELNGKSIIDIPVIDWSQIPPKFVSTQAYVVNASYTPTQNGIYIPLGYIQPPFVDLDERGLEYNLSQIGFTIAHEMSHSLDDWGSKYDEYGVLNDWWTDKDKKTFKKIQTDVVKQYETFASYDNIKFDAWPSVGEDLADISGLTICIEYLRDFQLKNKDILPIQSLSFEAFFIYFAFQQRQKISKKALVAQLKTNPHPLDKYRTNVPLSRVPVFRTIFDINKNDKMWWHSTNRIWED
jgi:putative endopeptidase